MNGGNENKWTADVDAPESIVKGRHFLDCYMLRLVVSHLIGLHVFRMTVLSRTFFFLLVFVNGGTFY